LFALPPIDEPPIVEPLPEGELADGLLVKPGEVDPDVDPDVRTEGLLGTVVASPGPLGAVAALPPFAPPPIVAPPPAAPAPPPPPCAYTAGANALNARVRAPLTRKLDARFRCRMTSVPPIEKYEKLKRTRLPPSSPRPPLVIEWRRLSRDQITPSSARISMSKSKPPIPPAG